MGIELVLNGANINFVAFGSEYLAGDGESVLGLDGEVMARLLFCWQQQKPLCAAGYTLNFYNNHATVDVDRADDLHG